MTKDNTKTLLRELPSVAELLDRPELTRLEAEGVDHHSLKTAIREGIARRRAALLAEESLATDVDLDWVAERARRLAEPSLISVINATGVVVHTNLGRSPLPQSVAERVAALACGYTNLEFDLDTGKRGHRHSHAAHLVSRVAEAEDALVVNNCAAAVMLCLGAIARDREVIVSRGELVEIGGSFRVPDVMRQSGAILVEVGTTNRTRIADYEDALTDQTALLLKVHRSNFAVVGFTEEASAAELAQLGRARGVLTMVDLGSGLVARPGNACFAKEPEIPEVARSGVDLLTFSGDKLLGGPQAGIIAGRRDVIRRLARHPMLRALRPDKLCLAALEGVLALHADGRAAEEVPTTRMLSEDRALVAKRRSRLQQLLGDRLPAGLTLEAIDVTSRPGGGSLPLAELPSAGLVVRLPTASASQLGTLLRQGRPPVIGRIEEDQLILDLRTVLPDQLPELAEALRALGRPPEKPAP